MRTKALLKLFIAMLFALTVSVDAQAKSKKVYATVQVEGEILCKGPLEGYRQFCHIKDGVKVQIKDISRCESGWVKVWYCTEKGLIEYGYRGYISVEHLAGDFIEEYKANTPIYKIALRRIAAFAVDFHIGFRRCVDNVKAAFGSVFLYAKDRQALSWTLVAIALLLSILFIRLLVSYDKDLKKPGIYYLVYAVTIIVVWGFRWYSADHRYETSFPEKLLLFMMTIVPALITINAAWHIRQCGIPDMDRRNDNIHGINGLVLGFPVWMMVAFSFWYNFIYPALEWAQSLEFQDGEFGGFVLGLLIWIIGSGAILFLWVKLLIPWFFKKAGKWTLAAMTAIFGWGMVCFGYHCLHAYFKGFPFVLIIFLGAPIVVMNVYLFITDLFETRCPRCHSCRGKLTSVVDLGLSSSKSVSTRDVPLSDVTPINPNAKVLEAKEKVETTTYWKEWDTWHVCPICGEEWIVNHFMRAGSSSRVVEKSQTEVEVE